MKTKQDLEKDFDEQYSEIRKNKIFNPQVYHRYMKKYIFEQMIPKVLNSVIIKEDGKLINIDAIINIKQKAKELYNIKL